MNATRGGAAWLARMAHNHQVAGSNPAPATIKNLHLYVGFFVYYFIAVGLTLPPDKKLIHCEKLDGLVVTEFIDV